VLIRPWRGVGAELLSQELALWSVRNVRIGRSAVLRTSGVLCSLVGVRVEDLLVWGGKATGDGTNASVSSFSRLSVAVGLAHRG